MDFECFIQNLTESTHEFNKTNLFFMLCLFPDYEKNMNK
jgi:hypothetical protein